MQQSVSIRAHKDETADIRTETYMGREYVVVPVVALVEGVLQGMNAEVPELALSEEFGKVPEGWNGRPVVMNHPTVNNVPVSANSPAILEAYSFGMIFNTRIEDTKLKMDAWVDTQRASDLGGEFQSTLDRLRNGTVIEVSTGLFTGTEKVSGKFNGRTYQAVWRNIVPDHLAFLSEGVRGACSVEDGCGTPRVNTTTPWKEFVMADSDIKPNVCNCQCGNSVQVINQKPEMKDNAGNVIEEDVTRLLANSIPDGLMDCDVRKLLAEALRTSNPAEYSWVVGFTASMVIYETYDTTIDRYATMQRAYNIDDSKVVTLGDTAERVNLLIEIMPASSTNPKVNANSKETTMADNPNNTNTNPEQSATVVANNTTVPEGVTQPVVTVPKPRTLQEYIAGMPPEMQEVFNSGLKLHQKRRDELLTSLKASGRNKFSDAELASFNMDTLEKMAELAHVQTYEGTASPRSNAVADVGVPAPIPLFPAQTA